MPDNKVFEQLTETYLLALCIWAEARNQGLEGMQAVGSVILNRVARPGWWGHDIKSVVLAPKQFSCFNEDDPQRPRMIEIANNFIETMTQDYPLRACVWVAAGLLGYPLHSLGVQGQFIESNVGAATHYHTGAVAPAWKDKMTIVKQIKDHIFYM
jgi:spore germination cell wall hydrolase CwlJ-like protein